MEKQFPELPAWRKWDKEQQGWPTVGAVLPALTPGAALSTHSSSCWQCWLLTASASFSPGSALSKVPGFPRSCCPQDKGPVELPAEASGVIASNSISPSVHFTSFTLLRDPHINLINSNLWCKNFSTVLYFSYFVACLYTKGVHTVPQYCICAVILFFTI